MKNCNILEKKSHTISLFTSHTQATAMAAVLILLINSLFKNKSFSLCQYQIYFLSLTYMLLKSSYNARDGVQISVSLPFVINLLSWIVHSKFNKHLVKLQVQNLIFVFIENN